MTLGELLGLPVTTESGERLGHVHDVRAELTSRTLRITGLVIGGRGFVERLGLRGTFRRDRLRTRDAVPWSDVVRADRRGIVVRGEARRG